MYIAFRDENQVGSGAFHRSSLLLLALSLLFLLLLREGVDHEELAVSRIPLRGQIRLVLVRHQNGTLERLHHGDVDVRLVFLVAAVLRPGKVVTNRLDFLHLHLPRAVQSILGDELEVLAQTELRKADDAVDLFGPRDDLAVLVLLLGRRLPPWQLLDKFLLRVCGLWPS